MDNRLEKLYDHFQDHPVITTDSRKVPQGSIFFALKGDQFNGNDFALNALDHGATLAVVDENRFQGDSRFFVVEDTLSALQQMAILHRDKMHGRIIGITGSNGKTTTKELINRVLSMEFKTKATTGNFNNLIGVPLTILSMPIDLEFGVVEMGANHIGEIKQLCEMAQPDFGIITNIGKAHLEGFGGIEGVIRAKGELYKYLRKSGGKVFINDDNELLNSIAKDLEVIKYGTGRNVFYRGVITNAFPFLQLKLNLKGNTSQMNTRLVGAYNFENVLAAACIGSYFGVPNNKIVEAIESYSPDSNRSQIFKTSRNTLILDAYNANPTSMSAAIENFSSYPAKNKVMILGDMLELGEESLFEHKQIIDQIKKENFSRVYLVGEHFGLAGDDLYPVFGSVKEFGKYLMENPISEANILLKGSRGIGLEKLTDLL
ncbi:MAG: UDP-N-acetylmuramoyl-tripeptide--D-alanyl-D-alanine ligase [Bacteroidales bacterium]|nr:UDP-N-acetylmuramoyl-tripeptide--D-alanyl-D-alanine ligase [Bacteroidales bacterium]